MPKTEFEAFRDYGEMRAKADYMHEFGVDTVADVAHTLAMLSPPKAGAPAMSSYRIVPSAHWSAAGPASCDARHCSGAM
jgi:ribonucleoside-diphosphate reductase beta chain